jgi:adenylate kinase
VPLKLILLGPPGAGKGTQAERLSKELGVPHVSTGNILRQAVSDGTPLGRRAQAVMDRGELVSDEIMLGIIRERLARGDCASGYILDGFPRTVAQAQALDRLMAEQGGGPMVVANVVVEPEELVRRVAGRRSCPRCGSVYNVHFRPPRQEGICDRCGNALTQRADDAEETFRQRLATYERETRPVIEHYRGRLTEIDGQGSSGEVFSRLLALVRKAAPVSSTTAGSDRGVSGPPR